MNQILSHYLPGLAFAFVLCVLCGALLQAALARSARREDERSEEMKAFWDSRPTQFIPRRGWEPTAEELAYDECQRAKLAEWRAEGRRKGWIK